MQMKRRDDALPRERVLAQGVRVALGVLSVTAALGMLGMLGNGAQAQAQAQEKEQETEPAPKKCSAWRSRVRPSSAWSRRRRCPCRSSRAPRSKRRA
ncbi:hypothetical protein [Janthinobacterium lividum]|uniref:hypothetical protein n=1 Tax=Janthinobacterium lividum TaxID=29581 RepID=UPI000FE1910F|nr:hypothetical protein [Janthinobacterium lividum]